MKKKLLIAGIVAVFLLLLLFLFRYQVATIYANAFYKPAVNKQFDQHFGAIGPQLDELGFSYTSSPPPGFEAVTLKCRADSGQVECDKTRHSDEMPVTQTFIDNWEQRAPAFATHLSENGWRLLGNQSLETFYANNDPNEVMGRAVLYSHEKTGCTLLIEYSPASAKTSASQRCSKILQFPDIPEPKNEY